MSKTASALLTHKMSIAGSVNSHGMNVLFNDTMYGLVFKCFFGFFEIFFYKNSKQNSDHFLQIGHFCEQKNVQNCKSAGNVIWNPGIHYYSMDTKSGWIFECAWRSP